MEIKTSFNVGDIVFFIHNNEITQMPVKQIHITVYETGSYCKYEFYMQYEPDDLQIDHSKVFSTKKGLLESL